MNKTLYFAVFEQIKQDPSYLKEKVELNEFDKALFNIYMQMQSESVRKDCKNFKGNETELRKETISRSVVDYASYNKLVDDALFRDDCFGYYDNEALYCRNDAIATEAMFY